MKTPQITGCTTVELESEGLTNGALSRFNQFGYDVEYDEENDVYRVGSYSEENDEWRQQ